MAFKTIAVFIRHVSNCRNRGQNNKDFYQVLLAKDRRYKAPIILKVYACASANEEHAVENYANKLSKEQHSAFRKTNGKTPTDFSETEFH